MEKTNAPHNDEVAASDKTEEAQYHLETTQTPNNADHVAIEAMGGESAEAMPKHYYRSPAFIGTFLSMACAYQGAFLFYVMAAGQTAIINADIGPSQDIVWVLLVYVLCQTVVFTLSGRFSDIFGRRWWFIAANTMAFVGYVVGGRVNSVNSLIGASVLSGLGSGVQQTMPVLMGELVPNHHRHLALAVTFVFFCPLSSIGPGLGRLMTTHASWRWVYYTGALFSGLSGLLQLFFYHPPHFRQLHTKWSKRVALRKIDYVGAVIFAGSAASLLLGLSWGGQEFPWRSAHVITAIVVGAVGLIVFALWERWGPIPDPLMPLFLFKNRNYLMLAVVATVGSLNFYALNVIWPGQVANVYGKSPDAAGWMTCTLVGGAVFGQLLASLAKRLTRFASMKWQLVTCCVLFTAFTGGMANITTDNVAQSIVFSIISSMMIGWMEIITLPGAPLMVEPEFIGVANGASYTFRGLLSALAVSIYVTILNNQLTKNAANILGPALVNAGLPASSVVSYITDLLAGNLPALESVGGYNAGITAATAGATTEVFIKSYQTIYLTSLSFGGVSILAALALDGKEFDSRLTPEIARRLQNVQPMEKDQELEVAANA